jgi:Domain of unknown function (DUF4124)
MPYPETGRAVIRIAPLLIAFLPLTAAAQMYKWVDEKGVTHYSETPPGEGKVDKVDIKPGPATSAPAIDWKQREINARQQRIQKEQLEGREKAQEQNASAERKGRCIESQRRLSIYQAARPVYTMNEKGEKIYLEDKDRQREIDTWRDNVRKYCD